MSQYLMNRINKLEQIQETRNMPEVHIFNEEDWAECKEQVEALKEGESVLIKIHDRKLKIQEKDTIINIVKRKIRTGDTVFEGDTTEDGQRSGITD